MFRLHDVIRRVSILAAVTYFLTGCQTLPGFGQNQSYLSQQSDYAICTSATEIESGAVRWKQGYNSAVNEADRRGLEIDYCAPMAEKHASRLQQAQDRLFEDIPDKQLCSNAIYHHPSGQTVWSTEYPDLVREAKLRGFSLVQCYALADPKKSASLYPPRTSWEGETPIPPEKEYSESPEISSNENNLEVSSTGSGFAVATSTIVTNAHVVDGCSSVNVFIANELAYVTKIQTDTRNDLALLTVDHHFESSLAIRDGDAGLGESIVVIGYPYTGILASTPNVSVGIVSAQAGLGNDSSIMQISAPVQPGNSGGPVLGSDGGVIGVIVARLSDKYVLEATGTLPQNINFAVKSRMLSSFADAFGVKVSRKKRFKVIDQERIIKSAADSTVLVACLNPKN